MTKTWERGLRGLMAGALGTGIGFVAVPALANDITEDSGNEVEQVVISANRVETPVSQVGSAVTVIDAERIEKMQAETALDVVKTVPGVASFSYGGRGRGGDVFIRGMSANGGRTLILVDGVKLSDASGNGYVGLDDLQASEIERVEVLRGNQSTLYGSDAVGGVISITTKSGAHEKGPFTGSVFAEGGTYNTGKTGASVRGRLGRFYYSGGIAGFTTDGWDISPHDNAGNESDGYASKNANLRLGADLVEDAGILDRLNVEGLFRTLRSDYETDGYDYATNDMADNPSLVRKLQQSAKLAVNADMFDGMLANNLAVSRFTMRTDLYDSKHVRTTSYSIYDGDVDKYEYQGTLKPADHHTVIFGADHQREQAEGDTFTAQTVSNDGYYANYILGLFDDTLTLTGGVRTDDHETFGDHTTWRTTAGYRLPGWGTQFHASYGTGFVAPSLYKIYAGGIFNSTLKPEESRGYDVGIEQSLFGKRLKIGSTFFRNDVENLLTGHYAPYPTWVYYNVNSVRTFGLENEAEVRIDDEWKLSASHTYMQARDNGTGQVAPTQPHHSGDIRIDYAPLWLEGLDLWASMRAQTWSYDAYANKTFVGGFATWSFGAGYNVTENLNLYGRVENLADKTYQTKGGYPETGRAGYVGLRMKF